MNPWLAFLLPVLLGAGIGWLTNAIAIRMLFRPHKAWYIGPFHVPLTPGIIPRQRQRLAVSLGRMVSQELFHREGLVRHLHDPGIQDQIRGAVEHLSAGILGLDQAEGTDPDRPDDPANPENPVDPRLALEPRADLEDLARSSLEAFFQSPRFASLLSHGLDRVLSSFLARPLGGATLAAPGFWRREFEELGLAASWRRGGGLVWQRFYQTWAARSLGLGDIWGQRSIEPVLGLFDAAYPSLRQLLGSFLAREDVRSDLKARAQKLLVQALDRLGGLQRGLLRIGGYEGHLKQTMPEIVEDALAELQKFLDQEENRLALRESLGQVLERILAADALTLKEQWGLDLEALGRDGVNLIGDMLDELLGTNPGPSRLGAILDLLVKEDQESTWAEFLAKRLGLDPARYLPRVTGWLQGRLRDPRFATLAWERLRDLARGLHKTLLAAPAKAGLAGEDQAGSDGEGLEPGLKARVDDMASRAGIEFLETLLPSLVRRFNLQGFVEARVAELDMAQLEALIVGLVGREFAWINIFGAILGGLIGLGQVLLGLLWQ